MFGNCYCVRVQKDTCTLMRNLLSRNFFLYTTTHLAVLTIHGSPFLNSASLLPKKSSCGVVGSPCHPSTTAVCCMEHDETYVILALFDDFPFS